MLKEIIKRDGTTEPFMPNKVNSWSIWASEQLGSRVDWSSVVMAAMAQFRDKATSQELQKTLIKICVQKKSWPYSLMAGRLYAAITRKEIYGNITPPTIKEVHDRLFMNGLMKKLSYSDSEYAEIEKFIDHDRDFEYAYPQILQLRKKYAVRNRTTKQEFESPQFVFMRMAMALAEKSPAEERLSLIVNWYNNFSLNRINAPSPNYVNLGTKLAGFASCCVYKVDDNLESLAAGDHIAYRMTAMSAGIGNLISTRSLDDPIRGGAISHRGKLPYYRAMAYATLANMQAGRGGACTSYYSAYDPENTTLVMLQNPKSTEDKKIREIHFGVLFNRLFTKKVAKNEDVFVFTEYSAPDLWKLMFSDDQDGFEKLYQSYEEDPLFEKKYINARDFAVMARQQAFECGTHYEAWIDEINRHTPFLDPVYSSNLCVAPETQILTEFGYCEIKQCENQNVNIWNGFEWSEVTVRKTAENAKLVTVYLDDGKELTCTPEHKWYVKNDYKQDAVEKRTHELVNGDKLIKFDFPVIEGSIELPLAYANGFYSGDGCEVNNEQRIYLYGEKRGLLPLFEGMEKISFQENQKRIYGHYKDLKHKFFVPDSRFTIKSRLEWLAGYLDADGCVYRNGTNEAFTATSVNLDFLKQVQAMLETLGVSSKIRVMREEGIYKLPKNDGSEENGDFLCQKAYRLLVSSINSQKLLDLGFKTHRLEMDFNEPQRDAKKHVKVVGIVDSGRYDDTYCFTEPKRHMGVFNGILTGQCAEIALPTAGYKSIEGLYSSEDHGQGEIAICSLAGIPVCNIQNDAQYEQAAYYALRMVDDCIDMSDYPFAHVAMTAKARRSAGVGMLGLATELARKGLKYDTQEGLDYIHWLSERHYYYLLKASLRLAKERGNAPWIHKTKWPQGWLPIDTYKKTVDEIAMPGYAYDWESLRKEIIAQGGIRNSVLVAHMPTESSSKAAGVPNCIYPIRELAIKKSDNSNVVDWVATDSDLLADKYQLAWDIDTKDMIKVYAVVQKFTDQGISADFWKDRSKDSTVYTDEMVEEHILMCKYGMKSRYYQNSLTSNQSATAEENKPAEVVVAAIASKEPSQDSDDFELAGSDRGCASGACSL